MKTSLEQNKDIIICEYIQNADILKFSFPVHLSMEELRGKIEIVARELSANSRAPEIINVHAGDSNTLNVGGSNNGITTATAKNSSTASAGAA